MIDMSREYKTELKILKQARRKVRSDWRALHAKNERIIRNARRESERAAKRTDMAQQRIDRRIAILEGRLSSN